MSHRFFEFCRASDGVVHRFERQGGESDPRGYLRSDGVVCVIFGEGIGWVARDSTTGETTGIPWCVPIDQQHPAHPPEGAWVSKKGEKSYVYELAFVMSPE